jgi:hypothetical protein
VKLLLWKVRVELARYRGNRGAIVGLIVIVGLVGVTIWGTRQLFGVLVRAAPVLADGIVLAAYAAIGVFGFLAAMRWGMQRLFLASDLELLGVLPIPSRTVFALKTLEIVIASPIAVLLLASVTWSYLSARGNPLALPLALVASFVLAVGATLPGMIATLLLASWLARSRFRFLITVVPPFLSVLFMIVLPTAIPGLVEGLSAEALDTARLDATGRTIIAALRAAPTSWPASLVLRTDAPGVMPRAVAFALCVLTIGAATALAMRIFGRTFRKSWTQISQAAGRTRRTGGVLERITRPLPHQLRALVLKDWRWYTRDLRVASQAVFPMVFFTYLTISNVRGGEGGLGSGSIIVFAFFSSGIASTALINERKHLAIFKAAPIRGTDVLVGKLIAFAVPAAAVASITVVGIGIATQRPVVHLVLLAIAAPWILGWVLAANLGVTALRAKFDVERNNLGLVATLISLAVTVVVAGTHALLAAWIGGRIGMDVGPVRHPVVGPIALASAVGTAVMSIALVNAGGRRLEVIDAP